jgi:Rod binding domain-containing protein
MISPVQQSPAGTAQLRQAAEKLVAQTFFGTILKQMRDSPFRSELFSGGRGGQAYQSMFDQQLVEKMSRGVGTRLVNSLVKKWTAGPDSGAARRAVDAPSPQQLRDELKKQNLDPKTRYGSTGITA